MSGESCASGASARRGARGRPIVALVFVQIVLGALVAGLKAGLAYNTWPLMDGRLIPSGLGVMQPWYLNLFENAHDGAVQPSPGGLCAGCRPRCGMRRAVGASAV